MDDFDALTASRLRVSRQDFHDQPLVLAAVAYPLTHRNAEQVDLLIGTIQASPAAPVPEPGTLFLVAAGAAVLGKRAWARRPPSAARG